MKKRKALIVTLMVLTWIGGISLLNVVEGLVELLSPIVKSVDINILGIAATRTTLSLETIRTIATWVTRAVWVSVIVIAILVWCPPKTKKR